MKFLELQYDVDHEITRHVNPGRGGWDRGDSETTWDIHGLRLTNIDGQYCFNPDFPVEEGDQVFVVYVVYSTGDSFGHDKGSQLELISMHKNESLAHKNAEALRAPRPDTLYPTQMRIEFDSGAVVESHCPWVGYFESLDYVNVSSFTVTK